MQEFGPREQVKPPLGLLVISIIAGLVAAYVLAKDELARSSDCELATDLVQRATANHENIQETLQAGMMEASFKLRTQTARDIVARGEYTLEELDQLCTW